MVEMEGEREQEGLGKDGEERREGEGGRRKWWRRERGEDRKGVGKGEDEREEEGDRETEIQILAMES